jgi:site-specific DNA-cytosine methylase
MNKVQHVTVREAFAGLPTRPKDVCVNVGDAKRQLIARTLPGEGVRDAWERLNPVDTWQRNHLGHVVGRPAFQEYRLEWDSLAGTHIGGMHVIHPEQHRHLSVSEAKRLGSYPDDYEIVHSGDVQNAFPLLFRAVLPRVGAWLAGNVRRAIDADVEITTPTRQVMDFEREEVTRL